MNPRWLIILALLGCACKPKKDPAPAPAPVTPPVVKTPTCEPLPAEPVPFGWTDSTGDENRNINAFFVNPINGDEVVCVVNGDISGYNKLLSYNIPAKTIRQLGMLGDYLPSVNRQGWILFSTADNNIFKVKANGDSLSQVTFGNTTCDPRWDFTGNSIYYFQTAYGAVYSQLVKTTRNGAGVLNLPMDIAHTAPFRTSDKIVYCKVNGTEVQLVLRDMVTQVETNLIKGPYSGDNMGFHFKHLALDSRDENLYWENQAGIFRCNLKSLRVDTVLKNCPRAAYARPIPSFGDEIYLSGHLIVPKSVTLYHQWKALELNPALGTLTELRIFN